MSHSPRLLTALLTALLVGSSIPVLAQAADDSASPAAQVQLLAALPITYGLTAMLIEGSSVQLVRAAPANLPGSRQPSYFAGRGAAKLEGLAKTADAVISLRSSWPEDSLYPLARRSNIRVIEIDAARPVDGALPGIATQPALSGNGLDTQPWLEPTNMGRMADIIAADLVRLAPDARPKIEQNLASLKHRLLQLSASSESKLAEIDNLSVVSLSAHFDYLISGLNLEPVPFELPTTRRWSAEQLAQLTQTLNDYEVALVLAPNQPSDDILAAIAASNSSLVVLEEADTDPVTNLENHIKDLLEAFAP
ncbi:ABC-type Zn uptake system ZnuABC, Zn-binding component ZnuA [Halopseudomonas sabulinigri]|uniref:ABC-type Zn uptake system ZnuABC, Zn-binding component ZnuA n=1 Tax=Halopseudomonas sabulinigri TaxID=472181 RepID=A0A1H1XWS7_9GAMM|nr:zinc ABC transporter substrate-binding protein [Halopseudomonas sabulinigri]SDT13717.1 ABC-type Zn uptake system ZnuABC, Zn-binding component ZnuA [Halopseudomonas sabulinigri]